MAAIDFSTTAQRQPLGKWQWLRTLLIGLVIWAIGVALLGLTDDPNLIPFVVLWGSFLVPVSAVIFFFTHLSDRVLSPEIVISGFVVGGGVGVLLAVAFEYILLGDGAGQYLGVGLIEEAAKLVAIVIVARGLRHFTLHDGLVVGAAVGFGFGAMESSGYALVSMFTPNGLSLANLVDTEILRGILAPLGHGMWTGILGGILFEESTGSRLRFSGKLLGAYLLVALLHALWDSMRGIAIVLTQLLAGLTVVQRQDLRLGLPVRPTAAQAQLFSSIELVGMAIVSLVGLAILVHLWRKREPFSLAGDQGAAA